MPHEIDGNKSAIFARTPAWHGLGVVKDNWFTSAEALEEAQMDWDVSLIPVYASGEIEGQAVFAEGTNNRATVRKNPHTGEFQVLGIVGNQYKPIQNRDAFSFLDELVGDRSDGRHYETAGVLRDGRQTFMTIDMGSLVLDEGGRADEIKKYLFCANSHDGSWAFRTQYTNTRVVCANTASIALSEGKRDKKISPYFVTRHTKDVMNRVRMAQETLGMWGKYVEEWTRQAEVMIQAELSEGEFYRIVEGLYTSSDEGMPEVDREKVSQAQVLYELAPSNANISGSYWGGVQSVIEAHDWMSEVRGGSQTSVGEMRLRKQLGFDVSGSFKLNAWDTFYAAACQERDKRSKVLV